MDPDERSEASAAPVRVDPASLELHSTETEWVNDWDLLSPAFQSEARGYLEIASVFIVGFLIMKWARVFKGVKGAALLGGAFLGRKTAAPETNTPEVQEP